MKTRRPHPIAPRSRPLAAIPALLLTAVLLVLAGGPGARAAALVPRTAGTLGRPLLAGQAAASPPTPVRPGQTRWSVHPSTATTTDARALFSYTAVEPGAQISDYVAVTNDSEHAQAFTVYAADAFITRTGAYDLLPQGERSTEAGEWTHLARSAVQLAAGHEAIIPFTVTVPAHVAPGDYSAGIVAQISVTGARGVRLDERVGARIYLRVAGTLRAALAVSGLLPSYHVNVNPVGGGSTVVRYTVTNTGNIRLGYLPRLTVSGWFGSKTVSLPPVTQLLPGDSLIKTYRVPDVWPAGPLTAKVALTARVVIGSNSPVLPVTDQSSSMFEVPWPQFVALVVLVAVGLAVWWYRRRHRAYLAELIAAAQRGHKSTLEAPPAAAVSPAAAAGASPAADPEITTPETTQ